MGENMANKDKSKIGVLILAFGIIFLLIGVMVVAFHGTMMSFPLEPTTSQQYAGIILTLAGIILLTVGIYLWQNTPIESFWREHGINKKYIALAIILIFTSFLGWLIIEQNEASIDYWMEKREVYTKGSNSITLYCKNVGESDGDFKLKLEFFNPSSLKETELPYIKVNDSTVEVSFSLHKGESKQETIFFTIPENVGRFAMKLDCVKTSPLLKSNPKFPTELTYSYNDDANAFWRVTIG
jgi:hypothetical protein